MNDKFQLASYILALIVSVAWLICVTGSVIRPDIFTEKVLIIIGVTYLAEVIKMRTNDEDS